MQEHKSVDSADFGEGWEFHVCETFHAESYNGELSRKYSVHFRHPESAKTDKGVVREISDIRRPLPV